MNARFPERRMRRLRQTQIWREMVAETRLAPENLVYPMFVVEGHDVARDVASMPGVKQLSIDRLAVEAAAAREAGVSSVILFGIPKVKDAYGSAGTDADGIVPRAIRRLKNDHPDLHVWADVCLCEYTDHGHCGVLTDGEVDNDATLPLLAEAARVYAEAGADAVAPSDMMDGRVRAIRTELDRVGLARVPIVSYAAKFASAFYGPFREAAESAPAFGDRRGYQMDPRNTREALAEVLLDIDEGADVVMVKPAGPYLDVIRSVHDAVTVPVAAYQVSGEFSMIHAAARNGWLDLRRSALESLIGIRRAGASIILTYFAKEAARWLREE